MLDIIVAAKGPAGENVPCLKSLAAAGKAAGTSLGVHVEYDALEQGLGVAYNRGSRQGESDMVLFVQGDCFLSAGALKAMVAALELPGVGAVVPYTNIGPADQICQDMEGYQNLASMEQSAAKLARRFPQPETRLRAGGFALLTRRRIFRELNGFDQRLREQLCVGSDFGLRLLEKGLTVMLAGFVHCNSLSQEVQARLKADGQADSRLFQEKWGISPIYSLSLRRDLLSMAESRKQDWQGAAVLEIGCAAGADLQWLGWRHPEAELCGVELSETSAALASRFAKVEALDVETMSKPEWQGKFDFILAGDIIEHLRDPWAALRSLSRMLKADGHLLISVPNVLYVNNVRSLLGGDWHYADIGILDRTHLRFFTRRSFEGVLAESGLRAAEVEPKIYNISKDMEEAITELESLQCTRVPAEELRALQWLFDAVKS